MINVSAPPIPEDFDLKVRTPGLQFLAQNPNPTKSDWKIHRYWKESHQHLYDSLGGICSYCAAFTPKRKTTSGVDHTSVDHFIPKSKNSALAYEWSNYRLCRAKLNNKKGDYEDVIDPYLIDNGKFKLDFTRFHITHSPEVSAEEEVQIRATIARLGLNEDDSYVNERTRVIYSYSDGKMPLEWINRYYPFIGKEIVSQDFDSKFLPQFKRALANEKIKAALVSQGMIFNPSDGEI
jgi:hypothetical protein